MKARTKQIAMFILQYDVIDDILQENKIEK